MNAPSPLPFSQACENNQGPIFEVLSTAFAHSRHVLEIGSGTGQHSVFLAPRLPHLIWQTSDLDGNHAGIKAWHEAHGANNLRAPLSFDLSASAWPVNGESQPFDAVFTSNTCHIVAWSLVQRMFALVGQHLPAGGLFAIYGPFNYDGQFTSQSNQAFDAWLRQRDAASGIRDFEVIKALAQEHGMQLQLDQAMPANNRTLVFHKL
ncbi:MAG: DUF938 domain-containing protein [Comamonas sp.]|jgi:cyclopropane fatty-acyl-phospholipid synthase-like methyltransferase|uniref:DUF938 domain-containing protein n=1 Tax=Comamonas sp. TaxID=34028 RepID=UPI0028354991|nr:DUF938 domain-containing protein [Comamonas sp.]MDR0212961.1 DUF938 domain-containing protein [Comamonas sp.]